MTRPRLTRLKDVAGGAVARAELERSWLTQARRQRARRFDLDGHAYAYAVERYNTTWRNERTVELPIVVSAIRARPGARVLELGNVLGHYGVSGHVVVDKYEDAEGVINCDVLEYEDDAGFDLIVSISTLEHTGFEEETRDPDKPAEVMDHLAGLLRDAESEAIVSFPLGYNPSLDELVRVRPATFGEMTVLRRVSADNEWRQTTAEELRGARYGTPYPAANALVIARRRRD